MYILNTANSPSDNRSISQELMSQYLAYEAPNDPYPDPNQLLLVTPDKYIKWLVIAVRDDVTGSHIVHVFHRSCPKNIPIETADNLLKCQLDELLELQLSEIEIN